MRVCVLHNRDHDLREDDPGREAREDVLHVAQAVTEALRESDLEVDVLPVGRDAVGFVDVLRRRPPGLVVNLCESLIADSRGEMAVPCLLDILGLRYTGSSALSLGLALHKHRAKELLIARGVPTPEFRVMDHPDQVARFDLPFPVIVKPTREDASTGVDFDAVVHTRRELLRAVTYILRTFAQPALVERYVDGREIYVPLLGNEPRQALPLTEIQFGPAFEGKPRIVTYEAKWSTASAVCTDSPALPCLLDANTQERVTRVAMDAFAALECTDYGRVDVRLSADGQPYVIDVNPNCDLHPSAGFARAAQAAGTSYPALALAIVEIALERSHGDTTRRSGRPRATGPAVGSNRNLLPGGGRMRARADRRRAQAE